jgi:glycosyltransferase involved in cell wall biosynthesis
LKTSLLLSIYKKNTAKELNFCFESIKNQSNIPNEIIFIIDGPIEESVSIEIKKWCEALPIKVFKLNENMGLAHALNYGLRLCTHNWVFRMDIDDVCAKDRFLKQIKIVNSNPDIDILGGNIKCFETFPDLFSGRIVPSSLENIRRFMKYRNPLNHSSVFFNRKKILEIGGYPNARLSQDYLLWINSIKNGLKILNSEEVLVYMKIDKNIYSRRGLKNLKYDSYPYIAMYKNKLTNIFELLIGLFLRFVYCTYSSIRSIINI